MPDRRDHWYLVQERLESHWSTFAGPFGAEDQDVAIGMLAKGIVWIGGSFRLVECRVVKGPLMEQEEEDLGTVRWFGERWRARLCQEETHVGTPDADCASCGTRIVPGDRGVGVQRMGTMKYDWWHLSCFRDLLGYE
jgi:hypothetical protein